MSDQRLVATLRIASKLLEKVIDRPGQARVLRMTAEIPGLTLDALRERLGLDKSTVSRSMRTLVRIGYLLAPPDPGDGRRCRFVPTSMGKAMAEEIADVEREHTRTMLADLSPEDRAAMRRMLTAVVANISHELRHPGRRCGIFADIHRPPRDPSQGPPP